MAEEQLSGDSYVWVEVMRAIGRWDVEVKWEDNSTTVENRASFFRRITGPHLLSSVEIQLVRDLMDQPGDSQQTLVDKARQRASRFYSMKHGKRRQDITKSQWGTAHCLDCGEFGELVSVEQGVCIHCLAARADGGVSVANKVLLNGVPRSGAVRVLTASSDVGRVDRVKSLIELHAVSVVDQADVVVVPYHSEDLSIDDHVKLINAAIGTTSPQFVLVLSCWTDPAVQNGALQLLATVHHPRTMFITFHDRFIDVDQRLADSIRHIIDTVVFPDAPPLRFLSALSQARPDVRFYQACCSLNPRSAGPMMITRDKVCPGCHSTFDTGGRWKKGVKGVRRSTCNPKHESCVDRLFVS